jgi:hypothetical protein
MPLAWIDADLGARPDELPQPRMVFHVERHA